MSWIRARPLDMNQATTNSHNNLIYKAPYDRITSEVLRCLVPRQATAAAVAATAAATGISDARRGQFAKLLTENGGRGNYNT